jgi:hypothetical protein
MLASPLIGARSLRLPSVTVSGDMAPIIENRALNGS